MVYGWLVDAFPMGDARQVPENGVTYASALDVPGFFPSQGGLSCLSAPKEIGLLLWDIGKDIFRGKIFLMV